VNAAAAVSRLERPHSRKVCCETLGRTIAAKGLMTGEGEAKGKRPHRGGKCTDCLCSVGFGVFWVGMVAISAIALKTGDARRLIFATDYLGNTCGVCQDGYKSCGRNIHYPRASLDGALLYGICVNSCPEPGHFVCNYDTQKDLQEATSGEAERLKVLEQCSQEMNSLNRGAGNNYGLDDISEPCNTYMAGCWYVVQEHSNVFFRCMPVTHLNTSARETCFFPHYQDVENKFRMPAAVCPDQENSNILDEECVNESCLKRTGKLCKANNRCIHFLEEATTLSIKESNVDSGSLLAAKLGNWGETLGRDVGDLETTWWTILLNGFVFSFFMGFAWIFILETFVGLFVWMMIILSLLGLLVLTLISFAKAGRMRGRVDVVSSLSNNNRYVDAILEANSGQESLWNLLGVMLSILVGIYSLILLVMRRKITLAIAILQEASKAIECMKSVVLIPLFSTLCIVVLGIYSAIIFGYIYTSGSMKVEQLGPFEVQKVVDKAGKNGMMLYHLLGTFWTIQVINGINIMTIASAVSDWYWQGGDDKRGQRISVVKSYARVLFFHFGTICFGALLIAIIQVVRIVVAYIARQTKRLQQENSMVRIVLRVLQCCLWCFEKLLKYITKNAYIMVAMYGCSFCKGAKEAISNLVSNVGRIAVVNFINNLISMLSILVIVCLSTVIEYLSLEHGEIGREINSSALSVLLTALTSFWIANGFMQLYDVTVDTILMCFCVDVALNRDSKAYYMGTSLRKIFAKKKKPKREKQNSSNTKVVPS